MSKACSKAAMSLRRINYWPTVLIKCTPRDLIRKEEGNRIQSMPQTHSGNIHLKWHGSPLSKLQILQKVESLSSHE